MTSQDLLALFPEGQTLPTGIAIEPIEQDTYLINGELLHWPGERFDVVSPIQFRDAAGNLTPLRLGSYPLLDEATAQKALEAAVTAYNHGRGEWPTMSIFERIACIEAFAVEMVKVREQVVNLIMLEIGKSRTDSEKEFDRTVIYIHDTINELKRMDREGSQFLIEQGIVAQVRRSPLGVVLCMGPYNYPLNETFTLLIPALIMGNTVLFKQPKFGSLLHFPLLPAFQKCFPKGVINTVYGRGATVVPNLLQSGKVDVLALIGSSRVADSLKKMHPKSNRLRSILQLDAKNAAIVLKDANMDETIKEVLMGTLSFNGQRCTALKILFVHRSIAQTFLAKLSDAVAGLKVGMPWEKGVGITPLPDPAKPAYIAKAIADAEAQGAKVINANGGATAGSLVFPAIVFPVKEGMMLYREEQFGPVIPVVPFDDLEQPLEYMINSDHGQQVSIFGSDSQQIAHLVDPLVNLVSRVNINAQCQRGPDVFPFTGRKDSAEGTLSVHDGLRSFSIRSLVATKLNAENKAIINKIVSDHESNFLSTRFIL